MSGRFKHLIMQVVLVVYLVLAYILPESFRRLYVDAMLADVSDVCKAAAERGILPLLKTGILMIWDLLKVVILENWDKLSQFRTELSIAKKYQFLDLAVSPTLYVIGQLLLSMILLGGTLSGFVVFWLLVPYHNGILWWGWVSLFAALLLSKRLSSYVILLNRILYSRAVHKWRPSIQRHLRILLEQGRSKYRELDPFSHQPH